jgi:DNA-binding LacI/PurR family transcriptional regulator
MIELKSGFSAIIAVNDFIALGAMKANQIDFLIKKINFTILIK